MFRCKICEEKDKVIKILTEQNKDLHDRLMAFNKEAFGTYQAEKKIGLLYPVGIDAKGEKIDYAKTYPEETKREIYNAFGEEPVEVEDKP